MKKIKNFIEHLESPSLNGVIFPDGSIKKFDIKVEWSPKIIYYIEAKENSSIEELENKDRLFWNDCAIITELTDKKESIEVVAGEGDYGSDGFIAVIDFKSKELIWLAFFNCSNPFNELKIKKGKIYAKSTSGCLWEFKIKEPVDFVIECPAISPR